MENKEAAANHYERLTTNYLDAPMVRPTVSSPIINVVAGHRTDASACEV